MGSQVRARKYSHTSQRPCRWAERCSGGRRHTGCDHLLRWYHHPGIYALRDSLPGRHRPRLRGRFPRAGRGRRQTQAADADVRRVASNEHLLVFRHALHGVSRENHLFAGPHELVHLWISALHLRRCRPIDSICSWPSLRCVVIGLCASRQPDGRIFPCTPARRPGGRPGQCGFGGIDQRPCQTEIVGSARPHEKTHC